ncbi:hypothetical protein BJY00DRAFT_318647 [Aspergillus carlsbadensis]|nr:hypothetical protein BJY00DRAFT_318647 [Aspergillus carlsbadensis]
MGRSTRQKRQPKEDAIQHADYHRLVSVHGPADNRNATVSIIAIHGLETTSPETWVYRHRGTGNDTNWLKDADMLPKDVETAQIYTYNWAADFLDNSIEASLETHAQKFLDAMEVELRKKGRIPIIFIASCFGGLLLAKALLIANKKDSPHGDILGETVGIVFLATPFEGSAAAQLAKWGALAGKVVGKESSQSLIRMLHASDGKLQELKKQFEVLMTHPSPMPLTCYFEQRKTQMIRRALPKVPATLVSPLFRKIMELVTESSASLGGYHDWCKPRDLPHVMMNKFSGPDSTDYRVLSGIIQGFVSNAHQIKYGRSGAPSKPYIELPYSRNENFVGRQEQLAQLARLIPPGNKPERCQLNALVGLDGIGKTDLAMEAVHRLREEDPNCSVFWVRADSLESLRVDYGRIRQTMGLVVQTTEDVVRQVNRELSTRPGPWLLIFDGVDDNEEFFRRWSEPEWFPASKVGSILLTLGNKDLAVYFGANIIDVHYLPDEDSIQLLRRGLGGSNTLIDPEGKESHTAELIRLLGGLPLAIDFAARYINATKSTVAEYLELWRTQDEEMISRLCEPPVEKTQHSTPTSRRPLAATWLITLDQLRRTKPAALKWMHMISKCSSTNIRISMIESDTEVKASSVIGDLIAYSLVTRPDNGMDFIDVHPLVQLAMKICLVQTGEWESTTVAITARLKHPFPAAKSIGHWKTDIGHVESIIGQYSDKDAQYQQPLWKALYAAGQARYLLNDEAKAEALHRRALRMEALKPATASTNGARLRREGKYQKAEELYQEAAEEQRAAFGEDHPTVMEQQKHLACTQLLQSKYQAAIQTYADVLAVEKSTLGEKHASTIATRKTLALAQKMSGDREGAIAQYEHIFDLETPEKNDELPTSVTGIDHLLIGMDDLAIMYQQEGQHAQSEKLLRRILRRKKETYGEQHPSTRATEKLLKLAEERRCSLPPDDATSHGRVAG